MLTINFDELSAELLEGRELVQTLKWIFLLANGISLAAFFFDLDVGAQHQQ